MKDGLPKEATKLDKFMKKLVKVIQFGQLSFYSN